MKKFNLVLLEDIQDTPAPTTISGSGLDPEYKGPVLYEPNPPNFGVPEGDFMNPEDENIEWKIPEADNSSFTKIRRSGRIKMSPYRRGNISVKYSFFTVPGNETRKAGSWRVTLPEGREFSLSDGATQSILIGGWPKIQFIFGPFRFYQIGRVDETRGWSDYKTLGTQLSHIPDISSDIESLKSDVATRLYKRWDALTDIMEGRETLNMARSLLSAARNPLQSFKSIRDRVKNHKGSKIAAHDKELRSKWLELRYGIMPTMYSIQDVLKLLEEKDKEYLTERSQRQFDIKPSIVPESEGVYTTSSGYIRISAVAKARFESPSSRFVGGTSLNVINTLWEVIPYSLVVDWFANVGDFLYHRSSIFPQSFESQMCYSIRRNITNTTFVRLKDPSGSFTDHPIRIEKEDTYERIPFNRSDIQLTFNPKFTSWKRWADAYALSIGPLTQALRRLK